MPTAPELIDPFHRELYGKVMEQITNRAERLINGSAARTTDGVSSVAENYAAQTAYIKALQDVLGLCEDIERDRYGVKRQEDN